jgi:hypothetical protein
LPRIPKRFGGASNVIGQEHIGEKQTFVVYDDCRLRPFIGRVGSAFQQVDSGRGADQLHLWK